MITSLDQLDFSKQYTYEDYTLWKFKERVELLKGRLFPLAAPNVTHQRISLSLTLELGNFLKRSDCQLCVAPFDVRLPLPQHKVTNDKIDTVVQPDLCVVCDQNKLDKQGCIGAPELIIEILSSGNSRREMKDKYELYEAAGVLEYWIVSPEHQVVFVYLLGEDKKFRAVAPAYTVEDTLQSSLLPGLEINLADIFPPEE